MAKVEFNPGTLVKVRGREWVLEACEIEGCVKLRPLGGTSNIRVRRRTMRHHRRNSFPGIRAS